MKKYTGKSTKHDKILSWMRDLGYCKELSESSTIGQKISNFAEKILFMPKSKEELELEVQLLQNRVNNVKVEQKWKNYYKKKHLCKRICKPNLELKMNSKLITVFKY